MATPPGKYPLLAILSGYDLPTVGELARATGLSQPATTRSITSSSSWIWCRLIDLMLAGATGLCLSLPPGEEAIHRSRATVWPQVGAAVRRVVDGLSGPLLDQIAEIERALAQRPLAQRAALIAASELVPAEDADTPGIVTLLNNAYRGSGTSSGWTTEAKYITGDRTTELLLRSDITTKPEASLMKRRDRRS